MVDVGAAIDAVRRPMNPGLSPRVRGNPAQVVFDDPLSLHRVADNPSDAFDEYPETV